MFQIRVIQQPVHARQSSFKQRIDRRTIDPPPIVQVIERDNQTLNQDSTRHLFCMATIVSETTLEPIPDENSRSILTGVSIQTIRRLKMEDNQPAFIFLFNDISVRKEGYFRLKFTLYQITNIDSQLVQKVRLLHQIYSDTFKVYPPKAFPGLFEYKSLTRLCVDQGIRIRTRRRNKQSQTPEDSNNKLSDSSHSIMRETKSSVPCKIPSQPLHVRRRSNNLITDLSDIVPPLHLNVTPPCANHTPSIAHSPSSDLGFDTLFQDYLKRNNIPTNLNYHKKDP